MHKVFLRLHGSCGDLVVKAKKGALAGKAKNGAFAGLRTCHVMVGVIT